MFIYFWWRERQSASRGGTEREGRRATQAENPPALRSWPEPKSDALPTEPPRFPYSIFLMFILFYFILFYFILFYFIFWERERETECEQRRGRERDGDTESKAGSRVHTVSTESDVGLKLMNCEIMTWAEVRGLPDWATLKFKKN